MPQSHRLGVLPELHQREVAAPRPATDHRARRIRDARAATSQSSPAFRSSSSGPPMSPIERVAPLGAVAGRASVVEQRHGEARRRRRTGPRGSTGPRRASVGPPCGRMRTGNGPLALRRHVEPVHRLAVRVVEAERDVRAAAGARDRRRRAAPRRRDRPGSAARVARSHQRNHTVPSGRTCAHRDLAVGMLDRGERPGRDARTGRGGADPRPGWPGATPIRRATSPAPTPLPRDRSRGPSRPPSPVPRSPAPPRRSARGSRRGDRRRRPATTPRSTGSCPRRGGRRPSRRSAGRSPAAPGASCRRLRSAAGTAASRRRTARRGCTRLVRPRHAEPVGAAERSPSRARRRSRRRPRSRRDR